MHYQQGYFNAGNWNTNWNQQQPGQGVNPNASSYGQMVQGGFNPSMQNPGGINQQWGIIF